MSVQGEALFRQGMSVTIGSVVTECRWLFMVEEVRKELAKLRGTSR